MSTKVSIVIPVYNIQNYIRDCLVSVINQTYKNIEIIIVNDGSTDDSRNICLEFKDKDRRIKLFDKKNGGLSDARNYGIKKSTGDMIFLLDGDDIISDECIEKLVKTYETQKVDIVTSKYTKIKTTIRPFNNIKSDCHLYSKEEALKELLYQSGCTTSAWGKLYARRLFSDISYPKGKLHEDLPVTYKLFYKADKIAMLDDELYGYRIRPGSITNTKYSKARAVSMDFAEEETKFISRYMPQIIKAAYNREFMESIYTVIAIGNEKIYKKEKERASAIIKKYRWTVILDKDSTKTTRRFAILSIFGPSAVAKIVRVKEKLDK